MAEPRSAAAPENAPVLRRRGGTIVPAGTELLIVVVLLSSGTHYGCSRMVDVSPAPVQRSVEQGRTVFDHGKLDEALSRFVDDRGMVAYVSLQRNRAALDRYVGQLASASPRSHPELFPTKDHELAYWLNAYNALMLRAVIDHYPVESVTDIMIAHGVFKRLHFPVGGTNMTLDDVEKGIVLEQFDAARAHFGLTCASMGCPRLQRRAWRAENLQTRLDEAGRAFLNSPYGVELDAKRNVVRLTSYFKWYSDDFGSDHVAFVRRYLNAERQQVLDSIHEPTIEYIEYDWRLNDAGAAWAAR